MYTYIVSRWVEGWPPSYRTRSSKFFSYLRSWVQT